MCKVIEKFAEKNFLEETYIITGHDPEIYHLYVYCCILPQGTGRRHVFLTVLVTAGRDTRPLQFIWVIFIAVKCAFSIAERAVPKQHP